MWDSLGFSNGPYDASPLRPIDDDVNLLIGRQKQAVEFGTLVESAPGGAVILSGAPGVGKTSFFNIQQYLMEKGQAPFGKKLITCRHICPTKSDDTSLSMALRIVYHTHKNIIDYCNTYNKKIPKETQKIAAWLGGVVQDGFDFSLDIAGFGGGIGKQKQRLSPQDLSFEMIKTLIESMVSEARQHLDVEGVFIALDNVENLENEQLADFLMNYRDTLFVIPNIYWVIIGQSGLGSLILAQDTRVAERLIGVLELKPISETELHSAIEARVKKFHSSPNGKAPLTKEIHDFLYEASLGEIRFIFSYANKICQKFVSDTRMEILDAIERNEKLQSSAEIVSISPEKLRSMINTTLGKSLVMMQVPSGKALEALTTIVKDEIVGLGLRPREKRVLHEIGTRGSATQTEYEDFGLKTGQDFSSNYLSKFAKASLLVKRQEGRRVHYSLRGTAAIAKKFDLLSS